MFLFFWIILSLIWNLSFDIYKDDRFQLCDKTWIVCYSTKETQQAYWTWKFLLNFSPGRDTLSLSPRNAGKQSSSCPPRRPEDPMTNCQQDQSDSFEPQVHQASQSSSSEHPSSGLPDLLQPSQPSTSDYQPSHLQSDPDSDSSGVISSPLISFTVKM